MATLKNTTINDTGYFKPAAGTTAQRPVSPSTGMLRWNTSDAKLEVYNGTEWKMLEQGDNGLLLLLDAGISDSYPGTGTTWYDISGNGNNGTISNATFSTDTFVYTSTSNTTVSMTNLRPTSYITQESWVQFSENVAGVMIGAQYGTSSNNSYAIWLTSANTWAAGVNTTGGAFNYLTYTSTLSLNTYYHFAHTYDGITQRIYLNGSQVNTKSTTGNLVYDNNNTLLAIGNDWNGSGYDTGASIGVRGKLAKVAIYSKALTADEVLYNYNSTKSRFGH